jgi:hypothetical protein
MGIPDRAYLSLEQLKAMDSVLKSIGAMLNRMLGRLAPR